MIAVPLEGALANVYYNYNYNYNEIAKLRYPLTPPGGNVTGVVWLEPRKGWEVLSHDDDHASTPCELRKQRTFRPQMFIFDRG